MLAFRDACKERRDVSPKDSLRSNDGSAVRDSRFDVRIFESKFSRENTGQILSAEDVLLLGEEDWLLVLDDFKYISQALIVHDRCWCGVPACVYMPLAAFAKMLIGGSCYESAFDILKDVNWHCLPLIKADLFKTKEFAVWVQEVSAQSSLPSGKGGRDDVIDVNKRAGARILELIGRMDLFDLFSEVQDGWWAFLAKDLSYLSHRQYEAEWVRAQQGNAQSAKAILNYECSALYYSFMPQDVLESHGKRMMGLYSDFMRSVCVSSSRISIKEAEKLMLIAFAFLGYDASIHEDHELYRQRPARADSPLWVVGPCADKLSEVCDAWWRPVFVSRQEELSLLLDALSKVEGLEVESSFEGDFLRFHRCLLRLIVGKDEFATAIDEAEGIAARRCAMYKDVYEAKDGVPLAHDACPDPQGFYFVEGLVRLYLGEFSVKADADKAKAWIYRMYVIDYPKVLSPSGEIGGSASILERTSYARDPGFVLTSNYFRRQGDWIACYAWANASRMLGLNSFTSQFYLGRQMDVLAENLSPEEVGRAQVMTREIISGLKGKLPPKYQSDLEEYVGLNGGQPDYFLFRTDSRDPDADRLGHFLRGLNFLGICDTEYLPDGSIYDLGESIPCRVRLFQCYDRYKPTLPLDFSKALACFVRAFNCAPIPSSECSSSEDAMLAAVPGFQVQFKDAMMTYFETTRALDVGASVIYELVRVIEKIPDCVSLADLRKFLKE